MNGLIVFENENFGKVRVVTRQNEPWFVASDVCKALELEQVTRALARLDYDEKGLFKITHPQNNAKTQTVNIVNEPGLYTLVLGSRKPQAKEFRRWITHEVIPAIRKTGGYFAGEGQMSDDQLLSRALQVAAAKLAHRDEVILDLQLENTSLVYRNQNLMEKASYYDAAMDTTLLTGIRETAKLFGIKQKDLVSFLLTKKYAYRNGKGVLLPYTSKNKGYFTVKEVQDQRSGWHIIMFQFTPNGRAYIHKNLTATSGRPCPVV